MEQARLIIDDAADGAWNMSMDQALLETANTTGLMTLRFYTWSKPTLSIGYFQSHTDRTLHPASQSCPLVRRRTGGGAILHHHELTYSLTVPAQNRWSKKNSDLYRLVHLEIIQLLHQSSVVAQLFGDLDGTQQTPASDHQTFPIDPIDQNDFMCFKRRADGDIILDGHKIVGSAQRRKRNALLQHGSILLFGSEFASEIHGLNEIVPTWPDLRNLAEKLAKAIFARLKADYSVGVPSDQELDASRVAYSSQFDSNDWNLRR